MRKISFLSLVKMAVLVATVLLSGPLLAQSGMMEPSISPGIGGQMMGSGQTISGGGLGSMGNMGGGEHGMGYGMGGYGIGGDIRRSMMGGYGLGGFMSPTMGGYGMGMYGMGGFISPMIGYLYGLNLTKKQWYKIRDLHRELRKTNLKLVTQLMDVTDKLDDLYAQVTPSPKDVGKVYESIFSIRRKMIENRVQEHNSIYGLLTSEQKKQLKNEAPYIGMRGMMMY